MAITTSALVTRVARVFLEEQPSASNITAFASRIDNGEITLSQGIAEAYQSGGRVTGEADELARLFFIMFGRAPDYSTFTSGMGLLESGITFPQIADLAMQLGTTRLSNSLRLSDTAFIDNLAGYMFTTPSLVPGMATAIQQLKVSLIAGELTRAQVLEIAVNYDSAYLTYHQDVSTSLLYLAALGRQATTQELILGRGVSLIPLVREALSDAGEDPFSGLSYVEIDDNAMAIKGTIAGDFVIDLSASRMTIDGLSTAKTVYSTDGGLTESVISLNRVSLTDITSVDMRELSEVPDTVTVTTASDTDTTFYGANTVNTVTAGSGDDTLVGNAGVDTFIAGAGDDTLDGKAGNDILRAGSDNDSLTGGSGDDQFVFAPAATYRSNVGDITTIQDFGNGVDVLDFSVLLGNIEPGDANTISGTADAVTEDPEPTLIDLSGLAANDVVLIANTGVWVVAQIDLEPITTIQLTALFAEWDDGEDDDFAAPLSASMYVAITYDPVNDADVWLISNFTGLGSITSTEIQLIGHISSHPDADLWVTLNTAGAIQA